MHSFPAMAADSHASGSVTEPATGKSHVRVPIRLDYPLLQHLMTKQLFSGEGQSREILDDPSGCSEIVLSEPVLGPREGRLEVLADLGASVGVGAPGACATLFSWRGRIGVIGTPQVSNAGSALGFEPERTWLLDQAGQPVTNAQLQGLVDV
ncbi:MAG: hypothetical protein R3308_05745, partial [Thiohalobacterales bacterium]|nr:hypothetical protein [Thiohalobacterales bacterium]